VANLIRVIKHDMKYILMVGLMYGSIKFNLGAAGLLFMLQPLSLQPETLGHRYNFRCYSEHEPYLVSLTESAVANFMVVVIAVSSAGGSSWCGGSGAVPSRSRPWST
jgi:hypothetical protein